MKPEPNKEADRYRIHLPGYESQPGWNAGCFRVKLRNARTKKREVMRIMASDGSDEVPWEHVSVSFVNRCPTWWEMCRAKRIFWDDDETVIQFHPAESDYVNDHEYCLHLWKPRGKTIKLPPNVAI